jgi:hypothetical protein
MRKRHIVPKAEVPRHVSMRPQPRASFFLIQMQMQTQPTHTVLSTIPHPARIPRSTSPSFRSLILFEGESETGFSPGERCGTCGGGTYSAKELS